MKPDINKLKETLQTFDNERRRLSQLIYDLEDVPRIKNLVGKYFKYKNNYNSQEYWWVYYHVKEFKNNVLFSDYFELDTRSKIEFGTNRESYSMSFFNPNYTEISKKEYETALKKLVKYVNQRFNFK